MTRDDTGCPSCKEIQFTTEYRLRDGYRTVKCRRCNFIFLSPYPSDQFLHDYYKARDLYGMHSMVRADYDRAVADRANLIRAGRNDASDVTFTGRAIDFGAGVGIAVAALQSLGFDACGIEANPQASAAARAIFDVEVADQDLNEIEPGLRAFTLFEVLEHIKYPRDFLTTVHAKLGDGAVFIGSVPNYNSLSRLVRGTRSTALSFPEHVNQFTAATLRQTLEAAGFSVSYIGCPPPYGVVLTLGLRAKLTQSFGRGALASALVRTLTFAKKYLIYPLPNLVTRLGGHLGQGLVFRARKPSQQETRP